MWEGSVLPITALTEGPVHVFRLQPPFFLLLYVCKPLERCSVSRFRAMLLHSASGCFPTKPWKKDPQKDEPPASSGGSKVSVAKSSRADIQAVSDTSAPPSPPMGSSMSIQIRASQMSRKMEVTCVGGFPTGECLHSVSVFCVFTHNPYNFPTIIWWQQLLLFGFYSPKKRGKEEASSEAHWI